MWRISKDDECCLLLLACLSKARRSITAMALFHELCKYEVAGNIMFFSLLGLGTVWVRQGLGK